MGKFQLNKKGEDPLKIYEDTFKIANDTVETHLDKLGKMPNPISESRASEYTMEDLERVGIEWDNSSVAERKEIIIDTHNGYTEGHDDNIVKNWNELSDHTRTVITQGKSNESKASEGVLDSLKRHREKLLSQGDSVNYEDLNDTEIRIEQLEKYGDESKASEDWEDEESERVQKALDKMNADAYMKQLTKKGYNEESLASEDHPVEDITDVHVHGKNNSVDKVSGVDITVEEADNYKQKDFGNQNEWEDDLDELRGLGGKLPDNNALWNSVEAIASEEFDISKYYKEVMEDGWMDYQCNSCGKKIDPDDGYGDQKDYGVLIQELKDHQINHKFIYESKANEWGVNTNDLWGDNDSEDQSAMADGLADSYSDFNAVCKICGQDEGEHRSYYPRSYGNMDSYPDGEINTSAPQIKDHVFVFDQEKSGY